MSLDAYINPNQICIFSKTTCGYCTRAKQLLNTNYNVSVQIFELDQLDCGQLIFAELKKKTNQTTVPNIFLFGNHIGGYTELKDLHDSGTLMNIVHDKTKPYICQHCGKSSSTKDLSCGCFYNQFNDWGAPY